MQDTAGNASAGTEPNPLKGLKSPPTPVFCGKAADCSSSKVKGFIANVKRVGPLSGTTLEEILVQLAACHLQEKAAVWITRMEATSGMPP